MTGVTTYSTLEIMVSTSLTSTDAITLLLSVAAATYFLLLIPSLTDTFGFVAILI